MATKFGDLRQDYATLWPAMRYRPGWKTKALTATQKLLRNKQRYQNVETVTNVPWFLIALFHHMESGSNFKKHLHNGDPLTGHTRHVPAGRPLTGHPPFTWEQSAIDAVQMRKIGNIAKWSKERICYELERYNGMRSRTLHHINTPYLWSGSNHYSKGKYIRDGVWSAIAVSKQTGAILILKEMMRLDDSIEKDLGISRTTPPPRDSELPKPPVGSEKKIFNLVELQTRLSKMPMYRDTIDNVYGANTKAGIHSLLANVGIYNAQSWPARRLYIAGQQAICDLDGIDTGEIDGLLGPQTRYAIEVYEARLRGDSEPERWRDPIERQPSPLPEPPAAQVWPRERDIRSFFGDPCDNRNFVRMKFPYAMRLAWDTSKIVRSTLVHTKIHNAAKRVLSNALAHYGEDDIRRLGLDLYGGCHNCRKKRGGSSWSTHAWAIAFDFDPARNKLRWKKNRARFAKPEYNKWWELWEAEGAISLGRTRDFDWMHVQFARL